MSYIKNCSKCGERISLREMSHGQWVAFDANTDRPHMHGKGSRKRTQSPPRIQNINSNLSKKHEASSNASTIVISILAVLFVIWLLS